MACCALRPRSITTLSALLLASQSAWWAACSASDASGLTSESLSAAEAVTVGLRFGAQVTRRKGELPEGEELSVSVPVSAGPAMVLTPGKKLTLTIPWAGGEVGAVRFGFGGSAYFEAEVAGGDSSGSVSFDGTLAADVCSRLQDTCHQISCYEQVVLPDGSTVSKATAMQLVLNCTQGEGCGTGAGTSSGGTAGVPAPTPTPSPAERDAGLGPVSPSDGGGAAESDGGGPAVADPWDSGVLFDAGVAVQATCSDAYAIAMACFETGGCNAQRETCHSGVDGEPACAPWDACTSACGCDDAPCIEACDANAAACASCELFPNLCRGSCLGEASITSLCSPAELEALGLDGLLNDPVNERPEPKCSLSN